MVNTREGKEQEVARLLRRYESYLPHMHLFEPPLNRWQIEALLPEMPGRQLESLRAMIIGRALRLDHERERSRS
jgi:hypothetical protein